VLIAEHEPGDIAVEELLRRAVEGLHEVLEAGVRRIDVLDVKGVVPDPLALTVRDGDMAHVVRGGELLVALGFAGAEDGLQRDVFQQHWSDVLISQVRQ
jgi:hypothetical protein